MASTFSFTKSANGGIVCAYTGTDSVPLKRTVMRGDIQDIRISGTTLVIDLRFTAVEGDYKIKVTTDDVTIGTDVYTHPINIDTLKTAFDTNAVFQLANSGSGSSAWEDITGKPTIPDVPEVAATKSAVSVSTAKRLVYVTADETNNGDTSLYFHNGTTLKFLQTITVFILCLFGMVNAQTPQTSYVVTSISAMKSYFGAANKIYVAATNEDYVICSGCTADEAIVYAGAGGRKWQKVSDATKVGLSKYLTDSAKFKLNADSVGITGYTSRGWHKKGLDSIGTSKVGNSDTAAMLANYKAAIIANTAGLTSKLNTSDTAVMLSNYRTGMIANTSAIVGLGSKVSSDSLTLINLTVRNNNTLYNTQIGSSAGNNLITGDANVFAGYGAGTNNTSGRESVMIGYRAGEAFTGGTDPIQNGLHVLIGSMAGLNLQGSAIDNVFIGQKAGAGTNNTLNGSVLIGAHGGQGITSGYGTVAIGGAVMDVGLGGGVITSNRNVAVGNQISSIFGLKEDNVFIGHYVGRLQGVASKNVIIGSGAGENGATSSDNTFIGFASGSNTTGIKNVFLGSSTGNSNTTGTRNVFAGYQAGSTSITGVDNIYLGYQAGANATGSENIVIGSGAGKVATTSDLIAIGFTAGASITSGFGNITIGASAGKILTTQGGNTILGYNSGASVASADNTLIGYRAGATLTSGYANTLVGSQSGTEFTTGVGNTVLGAVAANGATGSNNIYVGYYAGYNETGSNQFVAGSLYSAINNVYFGKGRTDVAPTAYTINGSGGSGTNIAGADVQIAGGKGTGTGASGNISFQTAPIGSSGAALNSLVTAAQVDANTTLGETRFLLYDVASGTLKRVSIGAADSGGTGYKMLRIPN